ncbi:hypothetical protein BOX30_02290 [Leptospirillum ferriphilum]|uniref:Uncharacterized protein n=2 Tax=Leptospirillum ferriphilum TaxID=178606 RepID=A0A1V3SVN9_9BACT|nr:hypothetical protein BOX24_08975 [Leptospirillum ferriphilum]OOH83785.1 hypothetical protein BOX30_02290 [Leptospirillum ferriphilum]
MCTKVVTSMYVEQKWKINREKNEHARTCPGLVTLDQAAGKMLRETLSLTLSDQSRLTILLFEDGLFSVVGEVPLQPSHILPVLDKIREKIEVFFPDFYQTLDKLAQEDRRIQVLARMENILGAIRNNASSNPELLQSVKALITEMESGGMTPGCTVPADPSAPEDQDLPKNRETR